jgi:hypothetical protein
LSARAKKVVFGVTLGGAGSFKGWRESTYFEFDPNPTRAERFVASRVVDNPFRSATELGDDPKQWMLSFETKRAGVEVNCSNCAKRPLSTTELAAANIKESSSLQLDPAKDYPVWLPPLGSVSPPHLLSLGAGEQHIAWINRLESHNTHYCVVISDPKTLLTRRRLIEPECGTKGADAQPKLAFIDLYSSSPQPVIGAMTSGPTRRPAVFTTGLSPYRGADTNPLCSKVGASLRLFKTADLSRGYPSWTGASPDCLMDRSGNSIGEFGFFQHAPIIKGTRHIYLGRSLFNAATIAGSDANPNEDLRAIVVDVDMQSSLKNVRVTENIYAKIPERHGIVTALTSAPDDLRLVSMVSTSDGWFSKSGMTLFETNLAAGAMKSEKDVGPQPKAIPVKPDPAVPEGLHLHGSWSARPINIVEFRSSQSGPPKTQFFLSRSAISPSTSAPGSVVFEFLVAERSNEKTEVGAFRESDFVSIRNARCTVHYTDTN